MKSLAQRKIDARNDGWPWPIDRPHDERALLDGCHPDFAAAERVRRFFALALILPRDGGGVKPFRLLDWWYRDVIAPLYGWKRSDGRRRFDKGFVTTAKKSGKALAVYTRIPTPGGWTTMGEIRVGDMVFDDAGRPTRVVAATPVMSGRPCYRVRFSDGTAIVADAGHLWVTERLSRRYRRDVVTTRQIAGTVSLRRDGAREHRIPCARALECPERELPIDPYYLGCWLGNGTAATADVTMHAGDVAEYSESFARAGVTSALASQRGLAAIMAIGRRAPSVPSMRERLRKARLKNNKHIPGEYLRSSIAQRLALLQGLMDTDGSVDEYGMCIFTNVSRRLIDGIVELVRSLGWKPMVKPVFRTGRMEYYVAFRAHREDSLCPFRLRRKVDALHPRPRRSPRGHTRQIVAVERVESVPVRCIQVANPDGMYLAGDGMIATHNSTVLSGLAAYMLGFDGEEEAEVYSAAVDRDQASIVYRKVARNVRLSRGLRRHLRVLASKKQIWHDASGSRYEAISSDADSSEGLNPHCLIADEVHVWRDRQFFNSLMYGDIARAQPLFLMITTAGDDDKSIGFEEYQYATDLLDGTVYSMSHFAFVAEAGAKREWDDPEGWLEAQPSLRGDVDLLRPRDETGDEPEPVRIGSLEKLQAKCEEAKASPRKRREFVRYICNRWVTDAENTWLSVDAWRQCAGESIPHFGEPCAAGLDLSQSRDTTSLCLAFRRGDIIDLEWMFWLPADSLKDREEAWRVPLRDWTAQGWLTVTPGNVVDYQHIRTAISGARFDERGQRLVDSPESVAARYDLRILAYDPWNSRELVERQLFDEDGIKVGQFRQGYRSMSEPCKAFERLVLAGKINHGGNPIAGWQAKNVVCDQDPAGNIKPNKDKSRSKIDGIVAAIMAVGALTIGENDFSPVTGSLFIT